MRMHLFVVASLMFGQVVSAQQSDSAAGGRSGKFVGIIRSSTTGEPVQSADIRLSYLDSVHVSHDTSGVEQSELFVDSTRSRVAATDPAGRFTVRGISRGHYAVQVRRIGFEPFEAALALDTTTIEMELTLTQVARLLPRVVVTTNAMTRVAEKLERSGFAYRRKASGGGTFVERSDILRMHPLTITDLLRNYGVGPTAAFVLDRVPVDWETLETYPVDLIIGVEVYLHRSSLPTAYNMTRRVATAFGNLQSRNAQSSGQQALMQPTVLLWSYVP